MKPLKAVQPDTGPPATSRWGGRAYSRGESRRPGSLPSDPPWDDLKRGEARPSQRHRETALTVAGGTSELYQAQGRRTVKHRSVFGVLISGGWRVAVPSWPAVKRTCEPRKKRDLELLIA